jgi:hypothetical protein
MLRLRRVSAISLVVVVAGLGLAACGGDQADELTTQLRDAGYTNVEASADYDTKRNTKKKKNERKLDDYEATAKAGNCEVTFEQDPNSTTYAITTVAGKTVTFSNLTASALIAEVAKQGVTC